MAAKGTGKLKAGQLRVNGKLYELPKKLTLGQAADIEQASGVAFGSVGGVHALISLLWISMRREDPNVTLADVQALDFDEIEIGEDEASPPVGKAPAARRQTTKKRPRK